MLDALVQIVIWIGVGSLTCILHEIRDMFPMNGVSLVIVAKEDTKGFIMVAIQLMTTAYN